ncbi:MAG: hypothetical protein AAFR71_05270 [Pseudomonadota bacterium]
MAKIINLQTFIARSGPRRRETAAAVSAEILFFDGVRYEPLAEQEVDEEQAYLKLFGRSAPN